MATKLAEDTRPRAKFLGVRGRQPVKAGGFHWVPGSRGSNPNSAWPPRGLHVEFDHAVPCSSIAAGGGQSRVVVATTVLELYDETSAFGRRLKLAHNCSEPLYVFNMSVSVLSVARDRDITTSTDAAVSKGRQLPDLYRETRYSAVAFLPLPDTSSDYGPGLSDFRADDEPFESFFVAGLDEGLLLLSLTILVYTENPYEYNEL